MIFAVSPHGTLLHWKISWEHELTIMLNDLRIFWTARWITWWQHDSNAMTLSPFFYCTPNIHRLDHYTISLVYNQLTCQDGTNNYWGALGYISCKRDRCCMNLSEIDCQWKIFSVQFSVTSIKKIYPWNW